MTQYDVWAADQISVGVLLLLLAIREWMRGNRLVAGIVATYGVGRAGCTALWPDASDAQGSICDKQLGFPLTVALLLVVLIALWTRR